VHQVSYVENFFLWAIHQSLLESRNHLKELFVYAILPSLSKVMVQWRMGTIDEMIKLTPSTETPRVQFPTLPRTKCHLWEGCAHDTKHEQYDRNDDHDEQEDQSITWNLGQYDLIQYLLMLIQMLSSVALAEVHFDADDDQGLKEDCSRRGP
jgi:hypothetical protein